MNSKLVSLCIGSLILGGSLNAQETWQSALLTQDQSGALTYHKDKWGFVLPDFSQAGYKNGQDIPVVDMPERTVMISPLADPNADNTKHIQEAIDKAGAFSPDANGFRGIVYLTAGFYNVDGTINLKYDGVIMRGEGNLYSDADSTVLYARNAKDKERKLIVMGPSASGHNWGNGNGDAKVNIVNEKVMPGDRSFQVEDASAYSVGDLICIKFPSSESWLEAMLYGGNTQRTTVEKHNWKASNIDISYHRYITNIEGNTIEVDAPVYYTLDKKYAQAYIYKIPNQEAILHNLGIENMHLSFERTPSSSKKVLEQDCIYMCSVENSWVKGVSMTGFNHAGIKITSTTRSTVEDCYSIDPSGYKTGGTWYNFETYHRSQLILFKDCYARAGRHHYLSNGCATVSGIVVKDFRSENSQATAEGHRMLSQGILFDNWQEVGTVSSSWKIGMYLRNNMGTAHGWGGTHSVFWNCDVKDGGIYLDKEPTGQNYAIGCTAKKGIRRYYTKDDAGYIYVTGYTENVNRTGVHQPGLQPASLYDAQKAARKSTSGITSATINTDEPRIETDGNSIKVKANANASIAIYSTDGKRIQSLNASSADFVESAPLNKGLYIVLVQEAGKQSHSRKVIIR